MFTEQEIGHEARSLQFNGGDLITVTRRGVPGKIQFVGATFAEAAGAAPVELRVQLPDGQIFNLAGTRSTEVIEKERLQELRRGGTLAAGNVLFKPQVMAPLFPMANRLTGNLVGPDVIEATVLGQKVKMPLNHGRGPGQRPHHLHGLLYDKSPAKIDIHSGRASSVIEAYFPGGFEGNFWKGAAEVTITQTLMENRFRYFMKIKNVSKVDMPVGAGAHPYFVAPSGNPAAVKLDIPGRKIVEIDNYENVLPTGKISGVPPELNFNSRDGVSLNGRYLDNLWVDLETENGFAHTSFIDMDAKLKVTMRALTPNIIGIQSYAPAQPNSKPGLGVFVALELVTNLPDPREELWGETPTGMKMLKPGEIFEYGYELEISNHRNE